MGKSLILLWLHCLGLAYGVVQTYHFDRCRDQLIRTPMGLQNRWDEASQIVPPHDEATEVREAEEFVYQTYETLLRARRGGKRLDEAYIAAFLSGLRSEDRELKQHKELDLRYLIFRNPETGEIEGAARLLTLPNGASGQLPALVGTPYSSTNGNRAEIQRLVGLSTPGKTPVPREIGEAIAAHLKQVFPKLDYAIYIRTDRARSRLYQSEYSFSPLCDDLGGLSSHLLWMNGEQFYDIYIGHIKTAYQIVIEERDVEKALNVVYDYRKRFHLENYGPNLNAEKHVRLFGKVIESGGVSFQYWHTQMQLPEKSRENLDWELIFNIRAMYDFETGRGNLNEARILLRAYLQANPVDRIKERERWNLLMGYYALYEMHAGYGDLLRSYREAYSPGRAKKDREEFEALHLTDDTPLSVVTKLLEPSQSGFLMFTNPYLYYLKGRIFNRLGKTNYGFKFLSLGYVLVDPKEREEFSRYWKSRGDSESPPR